MLINGVFRVVVVFCYVFSAEKGAQRNNKQLISSQN